MTRRLKECSRRVAKLLAVISIMTEGRVKYVLDQIRRSDLTITDHLYLK